MKPIDKLNEKRNACPNCYPKIGCWTCHWNQLDTNCKEPCTKNDWENCVYNKEGK